MSCYPSSDLWSKATLAYLQDQMISLEILEKLFDRIESMSIDNEKHCHLFLCKLFSLCLFLQKDIRKLYSYKDKVLHKIQTVAYYDFFFPVKILQSMVRAFFEEQYVDFSYLLENEIILMGNSLYDTRYGLPNIASWCEILIVVLLFSHNKKDKKLQRYAKNSICILLQFFDPALCFFEGLWTADKNFEQTKNYCFVAVFMQMLQKFFIPPIANQKNTYLEILQKENTLLHLFPAILSKAITTVEIEQKETLSIPQQGIFASIGTAQRRNEDFASVITFAGQNSGMGSIHCGDVQVITFGPQIFPLDEMKNFGIFRQAHSKEMFNDIIMHYDNDHLFCKGWTRLYSEKEKNPSEGDKTWVEMQAKCYDNLVNLFFNFGKQVINKSLALAFYVKAKTCLVDNTVILPLSLDKYQGNMPYKLSFRGKQASMNFIVENEAKIHIIPLAGNDCFWNANFLFIVEPSFEKEICKITIGKI